MYESYLNSWPTDSQWYNGGGSAEETSYAYRGHLAARDMALQAKDNSSAQYHDKMLKRIKDGFQKSYGSGEKGIPELIESKEGMKDYMKIRGYILFFFLLMPD